MSLLRRLFGTSDDTVDDPVFGRLTRRDGQWSGSLLWTDGARPVALTVERQPGPPNATDHLAYQGLRGAGAGLGPLLGPALYAHWTTVAGDLDPPAPAIDSSEALWAALHLQGMSIAANGSIDLIYGFSREGWPEGAFVARLAGRRVEKVEYVG